MRCSFCSNPDTWSKHIGGEEISSKEIAQQLRRYSVLFRACLCSRQQVHVQGGTCPAYHHRGLSAGQHPASGGVAALPSSA